MLAGQVRAVPVAVQQGAQTGEGTDDVVLGQRGGQRAVEPFENDLGTGTREPMSETKSAEQALPEPVRDHLGQQLRAVYSVTEPQPRYLGDAAPAVPEVFAPQIERLETRLKTHEEGTEAVEQALDKILDAFGVAPPENART